jgi:hypothetical protein
MILAHAFGQRYDLPIPLVLFVVGGALVVVVSFLLVFRRAVPAPEDPDEYDGASTVTTGTGWGAAALVVLVLLVYCGFAGTQTVSDNILPTVFWLLVWIGVPLSCGLVGDWTRPVNPFGRLTRITDNRRLRRLVVARDEPLAWPRGLGWWPAATLFFLLASAELVFNLTATLPRVIATGLLVYAVVCAVAGLLFGTAWTERGEVFSVLFATWGRLGWFRFGAPGRRGFTGGLAAAFAPSASRIAFVLLLLISVNFDGLLATPRWDTFEKEHVRAGDLDLFRIGAFVTLALVIAVVFGAFAQASARAGRHRVGPAHALAGLLPSMVPIAFAYLLAHNLQYLLVNGQALAPLIGNPTGTHSLSLPSPFASSFDPNPTILPSAFYWYAGVVAIVAAHVLAVVLAHRHLAHAAADDRLARRSEYPWLVAMVAYTMVSLTLIAQPLVADTSGGSAARDPSVAPGVRTAGPPGPAAGEALQHRLHVAVDAPGQDRHRP